MTSPLVVSAENAPATRQPGESDSVLVPLCVDLDGTLLRTDVLIEGILTIVTSRHLLAKLPRLLTNRRARLKQRVAELAMLDPALLPYNEELLDYLRLQRSAGRSLVLATGADARASQAIADHLGLFDRVISSDGMRNLKGEAKAAALIERFGRGGFAYVGSDSSDVPVWREARSIVIVNAGPAIRKKARNCGLVETEFHDRPSLLGSALSAMRPHQWVKNLLVFVPMIAAHALGDTATWINAFCVFAAFCATAAGTYIFNDLTDLAADRRHPRKRYRPLASGMLPITVGIGLAVILVMLGFTIFVTLGLLPLMLIYTVASISYSLALKEFPLVDVFMLSGLYTLRLLGGGLATGHPVSLWLLAFSGFLFLSLALLKRTGEIMGVARARNEQMPPPRGYRPDDAMFLQILGCASAFSSSVVLALFVGSTAASAQYRSPELLWAIVPLILFWLCRLWLSTVRGQMHDDPIAYVAHDRVSWIVAGAVLAVYAAASLYSFSSLQG